MILLEKNCKHLLLVALLIGAASTAAAQGCFSVGENTKVQFSLTNWKNAETYDLFQWTDIQSRLTDGERLLTKVEWTYLLTERTDAFRLYARAKVNGKEGMVLLPDKETWVLPEGLDFNDDDDDRGYATNRYDNDDWTAMEQAGAVFLPADGYSIDGTELLDAKQYGTYWTSSLYAADQPYHIQFDLGYLYYENMHSVNSVYRSVRTVKAWEPQGIEEVSQEPKAKSQKLIKDGQLFIEKNGKFYNVMGAEIIKP